MEKLTSTLMSAVWLRALLLSLTGLLAACATSVPSIPYTPPHFVSRPPTPEDAAAISAQLAKAGVPAQEYGLLTLYREERFVAGAVFSALLVEGEVVAVMQSGKTVLPVQAGDYLLEVGSGLPCDSLFAHAGCDENPFPPNGLTATLSVAAGQVVTLEMLFDEDRYKFRLEQRAGSGGDELPRLDGPVARIDAPVRMQQSGRAQQTPVAPVASASSSLPPDLMRDKLMIGIARLLRAGRYSDALPLFEQLDQLPLPLDPDFDYYWGQALGEAGQDEAALARLYRYIRKQGRSAGHYRAALALIGRLEDS